MEDLHQMDEAKAAACGKFGRISALTERYWWMTHVVFIFLTIILLSVITLQPSIWIENTAFVIWLLSFLVEIAKWVILIRNRKWNKFVISLIIAVVLTALSTLLIFVVSFASLFEPRPDDFAKEHPIPQGLKYNVPSDIPENEQSQSIDKTNKNAYLQIWNGFQGGIYFYDFYYPTLPAGTVYLKCFEAGTNTALSESRLKDKSAVKHAATTEFSKIVDKQEFTIYEGDWGQYYAVRVEVWHREKDSGKEKKLLEKIYRMEGWMR